MSKMQKFMSIIQIMLPVVLATAAPELAPLGPVIVHAIGASEAMKGATGQEKLQNALGLTADAVDIANGIAAAKGQAPIMNKDQVLAAASGVISTTVNITNIVHNLGTAVTLPPAPPAPAEPPA